MPTPERIRIAQELHDGIAQDLVGIGYSLDLLLSEESLSAGARSDIRQTRFAVDELIAKVRAEILDLRKASQQPLHIHLREIATGLCSEVQLALDLEEIGAAPHEHSEIVAITTEILRNCLAHSRATHIGINLYSVNNRICLEVIDNGIGGANVQDGHYGLPGLIERVHNLGGSITIESIEGTRIALLI
jgi:NarL family two-component system sensor histidine kinase LiaS